MTKQIAKLTLSIIAAISLPAFSAPELTAPTTVSMTGCYQAIGDCLLMVKPTPWKEGQRHFSLAPVCQSKTTLDLSLLYNHELKTKDQINKRVFLGRTFCKGVLSLSDMHLPFVKERSPTNHHFTDANDGILLLNTAGKGLKSIKTILLELQSLAIEAASAATDKADLFIAKLWEINRIANTSTLDDVSLLNCNQADTIDVPIHHGKDKVTVTLTHACISHDGLNISTLNIESIEAAKAALQPLADAITTIETGLQQLEQSRPAFEAALSTDETVTIMDLSGPIFTIKQMS